MMFAHRGCGWTQQTIQLETNQIGTHMPPPIEVCCILVILDEVNWIENGHTCNCSF